MILCFVFAVQLVISTWSSTRTCMRIRNCTTLEHLKQLVAIAYRMSWANRKLPMFACAASHEAGEWGVDGIMMPLISCLACLLFLALLLLLLLLLILLLCLAYCSSSACCPADATFAIKICLQVFVVLCKVKHFRLPLSASEIYGSVSCCS